MARDESLPFPVDGTYYNGGPIDANDLGGVNLEGQEYVVPVYQGGGNDFGLKRTLRVVRNVAAFSVLPKRLVTYKAGFEGRRVDGYAAITAAWCAPVVEEAPPNGVPTNDLTYVVVEGPALVKTDLAGGANNVIPAGSNLVSLTAATSGATGAGRVAPQDTSGATTPLANQIQNRIGRALSAVTTGNTNADLLVGIRW